jgi:hypothetical protein
MIGVTKMKKKTWDTTKTLSVPEVGRKYFGLGMNASYRAAQRGDIPVVKIGRIIRVPVAALEKMLQDAGSKTKPAA